MSFLVNLKAALNELVTFDNRPVVVSSAMWPVLKAMGRNDPLAVEEILDLLIYNYGSSGLLMPCFTNGFDAQGLCNLDEASGNTGVLSEFMRRRQDSVRTLSAWFSYIAIGACTEEISNLLPKEAWGEGSLYEWMEYKDASFLMLATHPTHCSYLHRLEWLAKDVLSYRFNKSFKGILVRNGLALNVQETLFVRQLHPTEAVNDFTKLMPHLKSAGMRSVKVNGINVTTYNACAVREAVLPFLRLNPDLVLRNHQC